MIILAFVKYVAKMLRKSLDASAWNVKHVTNMVIQDASVMVGRDVRRSAPDGNCANVLEPSVQIRTV